MEYFVLFLIAIGGILLLWTIYKWFVRQRYPQKTGQMLDSIAELEQLGLKRTEHGYAGLYQGFPVNIYATTSMKRAGYMSGEQLQVWILVMPFDNKKVNLGGFFSNLIVQPGEGFVMVGYIIQYVPGTENENAVHYRLQKLTGLMQEKGIQPYVTK